METQNKWFRGVVAVAVIAALVIGAVNAVVFSSWRDNVIIEQGKVIEQQRAKLDRLEAALINLNIPDEIIIGACYGSEANARLNEYFKVRTAPPTAGVIELVFRGQGAGFKACLEKFVIGK